MVFIPLGFYCLEGSSAPLLCPAGTLSMIEGLASQLDCAPCPPGFYCNISGLTRPSGVCSAGHLHKDQKFPLVCSSGMPFCLKPVFYLKGHFCLSGATEPTPVSKMYGDICPAGYYCPEQSSAPLPCPVGFICTDKGGTSFNNCTPCPPSRYCIAPGSSKPSG